MPHMLTTGAAGSAPTGENPRAKRANVDELICWWSIPIFYQIFALVFGYLTKIMRPPIPGPTLAQDGIIAFTLGNATHMQVGTVLLGIFLGFASMGTGVIVVQMRRMSISSVLPYGYLACGAAAALPGCYFCALLFSVAAFRPDRDPHLIALLYDAGFAGFIGCLGCFATQYVVFAVAIFLDRNRIFPKWLGYMTIWNFVTELVAAPVWIFKRGPYAWNGLLSFYLGVVIFVVWIVCVIIYLKKAISNQPLGEVEPA
ncbi:MAG TPA: hypothetical protein VME42_19945 [Steroidobacteraceae bacterium]|nr:hypothetical protein [Steroidobacteraceae bacterium]